jgi:hypothetical protein
MGEHRVGPLVVIAPRNRLAALRPLMHAHGWTRDVVVRHPPAMPGYDEWRRLVPGGAAGVLVIGDRRRSPTTVLPGLFVPDANGKPVAAGWVPAAGDLSRFAATASAVQGRRAASPVAVLGQRSQRYQHLSDRLVHHLGDVESLRWGAERITREDVVAGLASGLGAAIYLGHGRPSGWAAYRGMRAEHLASVAEQPLGALLSVTCWTASRWRVGTSFAEAVVLSGAAAASVGAVRPVLHLDTTRIVVGLAQGWRSAMVDVAGLLSSAFLDALGAPTPEASLFRLCGDPLARVTGAAGSSAKAQAVFAPDPGWSPQTAGLAS